jgi:hypothetical protein
VGQSSVVPFHLPLGCPSPSLRSVAAASSLADPVSAVAAARRSLVAAGPSCSPFYTPPVSNRLATVGEGLHHAFSVHPLIWSPIITCRCRRGGWSGGGPASPSGSAGMGIWVLDGLRDPSPSRHLGTLLSRLISSDEAASISSDESGHPLFSISFCISGN